MPTSDLPPGPKGHFLLGMLPEIRRDEFDFLNRLVAEYGDIVFLRVVNHPVYILSNPQDIEEVLLTNHENFIKSVFLRESKALFGNGLLTSDGGLWLRQRHLLQPAFHKERIAGYCQAMVDHTQRLLAKWQDGEVRDIHEDMVRLTMEIIAQVLFGDDLAAETRRASEALRVFFDQFDERFGLYLIPEWLPTPGNLRYRRAIKGLDRLLERIIRARRANGDSSGDILSTLLSVRDEDGTSMSQRQLRDEMMTLFFTGHETTSLALSWTWYLLSQHPEAEARLYEEIQHVLGERTPTIEDIPNLPYVDAVIKESLRLYPPAYGVVRQALKSCVLGGFTIPAGATVAIFQWVVHRDARYFERPSEFLPERWLDGLAKDLPRCAYFPFGVGPRVCIGNTFALTELALLVPMIVRRFQFQLVPGHRVGLSASLTLRPLHGIRVTVKKR